MVLRSSRIWEEDDKGRVQRLGVNIRGSNKQRSPGKGRKACEKANTLSDDVIRSFIGKNDCYFECLKIGRTARKCRVKFEC